MEENNSDIKIFLTAAITIKKKKTTKIENIFMKQIGLSALKSKSLAYDVGNNDNVLFKTSNQKLWCYLFSCMFLKCFKPDI